MAQHILDNKIDCLLEKNNTDVISVISTVGGKNFYAFATKYCHFQKPATFPIYDSNVVKALKCFKHYFPELDLNNIRNYTTYKDILDKFINKFQLEKHYSEIDHYLYQIGKKLK